MMTSVFEPTHLAVILVIALFVLGPKRLPATGRALGSSISNFKQALAHPDDSREMVGAGADATTFATATGEISRPAHEGSL